MTHTVCADRLDIGQDITCVPYKLKGTFLQTFSQYHLNFEFSLENSVSLPLDSNWAGCFFLIPFVLL